VASTVNYFERGTSSYRFRWKRKFWRNRRISSTAGLLL